MKCFTCCIIHVAFLQLLDQREMQEIQQHVTDLDNSIETLNLDLLDLQSNMTQGFSNITSATDLVSY